MYICYNDHFFVHSACSTDWKVENFQQLKIFNFVENFQVEKLKIFNLKIFKLKNWNDVENRYNFQHSPKNSKILYIAVRYRINGFISSIDFIVIYAIF